MSLELSGVDTCGQMWTVESMGPILSQTVGSAVTEHVYQGLVRFVPSTDGLSHAAASK